ncbi:MAG: hypothetical protein FD187_969 [bacterium]|nr:MAG: hypothetical protein FD142_100 [bacterium]KAF0149675.1 MAG: hypothetical protein FD187_969 [bacterium]KAF0169341.1 MAG: hypothetical protein FD158_531 [bacterium]TXT21385.1 MAG: hypothetical protein FD132_674 [bacterium]
MDMDATTPRTDVERLLLEMLQGQVDPESFARRLVDVEVFMPVKDEKYQIAGFQLSTKAQPLVVEDEEGNRVLITFSSPDRAKDFVAEYPGFGGGLLTEMSWILRRMGENMGLSINPGAELGYDFDADMVAMLASVLPEENQ